MTASPEIKPTDLRGILKYVPQWRGHTFVVSIDGSIVDDANLGNLMLDLAVLRNLKIDIVLVHGIGRQLRMIAEREGAALSDQYGGGKTDEATMELAVKAASMVSHTLMQGITQTGEKCVISNAVRAVPVGLIKGEDQLYTGKVDRIDLKMLKNLLEDGILPIISPVAFDKAGTPLRINSDNLATDVAIALNASKLIYLFAHPGLTVRGDFQMNVPVEEVEAMLENEPEAIDLQARSKASGAVKAIKAGTPRAHLLDGRLQDGLLTELFSKVGIGTMIHGNEYQQIRKAVRTDALTIYNITSSGVKQEALNRRSLEEIETAIEDYFVYEIDGSVIACARLIDYPDNLAAEVASVYVQPFYQGKGAGRKIVEYAERTARQLGRNKLYALTTQSTGFFKESCGFEVAQATDLPPRRQQQLAASGRNSRVFVKVLN